MGRITLYGFYQYDPTLFDDIALPDQCNRDILIQTILSRSGMLFPYHQQPTWLKVDIGVWFEVMKPQFERIFLALNSDYNPIENYDRKENWTDTPNVTITHSGGHTEDTTGNSSGSSTDKVSAFNTEGFVNDSSTSGSSTGTSKNVFTYQSEATLEAGTRMHEGRFHGNIGVTTNQQMIQSEIDLRQYNIYSNIAELFEEQFLMQVY